ncbi:hemerythrin domain-containing protein [Actinoplanes sp. TRM 88003]|uniref:Hemerythrin domain-containing protein n=1 Tax=Paractinoplanes aksuensis TaxID=2939490 RepID=A0ABT1DM32_9ACTN|nr:hemerythrin domain-containing protein [Actinoplanes aksuensis]MCO8271558.1 hemerythrin domain-containing protein [Actinoplanes aksuensis]
MRTFQIVVSPDVVDVLRHEHEQIRQLCLDVQGAGRDGKKYPLAALRQAVHRHQLGEVAVAHPAVRNLGPDGDAVALDLQVKGDQLDRSLAELDRLGVGLADFEVRFAAVCDGLLDHAADQERAEFPLLRRYVPAQRRHMMASAMQNVRIMALG